MSTQYSLFDDRLEPTVCGEAPANPERLSEDPEATRSLTPEERAEQLRLVAEKARDCTRCGLSHTRTHVVFGEGNPSAPLVLVGEGPGETEDATGRPFVGRAGKLLDAALQRNGLTRAHVYICNVVKCRAADLEGGRWINRAPTEEEVQTCRYWLDQQLRLIRPLVLVCVGAPSARSLISPRLRISADRGKWFRATRYADWALAVLHPAYILRMHGPSHDQAVETLTADLGEARRKVIELRRAERERSAESPAPPRLFDLD